MPRNKRRRAMEHMLDSLGDNWEMFEIDGILPAIMRKRKACLLRHIVQEDATFLAAVARLDKRFAAKRQVVSVTHSTYFWDYGLCAVDVLITFKLLSPDGLLDLYSSIEAFEEEMLDADAYKPPGIDNWSEVQTLFSRAFQRAGMSTIRWLTSPDADTYLLETCCWNLQCVLYDETDKISVAAGPGIHVSMDVMQRALAQFCGEVTTAETFQCGAIEYFASHTGYSGNAAVVINHVEAERVQWLWKVVALLYSALLESAEPCYDLVTSLLHGQGIPVESITQEIRQTQKIIDLLHSESNPVTICSESFDAEIYENVWNAWGGSEIDAMIDKRTAFLMSTLQDLSQQKSQSLQGRLNLVVFVLTLVSVASTVAAIIALQDPGNDLPPTERAIILSVLTSVIGIMCLATIALDISRNPLFCIAFRGCCRSRNNGGGGCCGWHKKNKPSNRNSVSLKNLKMEVIDVQE